jgi:APA family basic amino acid/polyamine antiporter
MPIGILGALAACTVLYLAVAAVLTGVVSYRDLGVSNPLAVALDRVGQSFLGPLIKLGAVGGLASVLIVNTYVPTRIGFAMSRDGLLPPVFSKLHPRFVTPHIGTLVFCVMFAASAALLPLSILGDLISFGTSMAFSIVCLSVIWLRNTRPDAHRPFKVPFGGFRIRGLWIGYVPAAAILLCWLMVIPAGIDIARQAARGDVIPASILIGHAVIGTIVYLTYGLRRARV